MSKSETVSAAAPVDGPSLPSRSWWHPTPRWTPSVIVAAVAIVVFSFASKTLIDDAYITLDYARNLAFHLHWGLIATATANTATSVLNVMVLGLFVAITRNPVLALGIVYVLSALALEYGLRRVARAIGLPGWFSVATTILSTVNPLLMSSIGLEVALSAGLVGLLLLAAVERRPVLFGLLAGLLLLTRPDLVLVVAPVFVLRAGWWRGWWRSLLAAAVVTVPWYLFSWIKLGSLIPDTLLIKTGQRGWPFAGHTYLFGLGPLLYLHVYPVATALSFLPAALGLLALAGWTVLRIARPSDRILRLGRLAPVGYVGVLYYVAYTKLAVPPYHWYYGTTIVCLTVFGVGALAIWTSRPDVVAQPAAGWRRRLAVAGVAVLALLCVGQYAQDGMPRTFAPITTNWASPAQYAQVGRGVAGLADGRVVRSSGEIGAEAYFCDCAVVDEFSDRADVVTMVRSLVARSGPIMRALLGWNFHFLDRAQSAMTPQLVLTYLTGVPPRDAIAVWPAGSPWIPGHNSIALLPANN